MNNKKPGKKAIFRLIGPICLILLLLPDMGVCAAEPTGNQHAKALSDTFAAVAKKVMPAVVSIKVEKMVSPGEAGEGTTDPGELFMEEFLKKFFGDRFPQMQNPRKEKQVGQGSGFIISEDGYILTNNHVVGEVDNIRVELSDGRVFDRAQLIGTDPESEVALIQIDATDLPVLKMGDSSKSRIGDWVMAIGNPFGLTQTLTVGIVSAIGRSNVHITEYEDFIQTDAAINPGNSGGPLINLDGEVIGINTAIYSQSGGYMGIGFAIPINMARSIEKQLKETGQVIRGYLGVTVQELTAELASALGVNRSSGALISGITDDSPAGTGGLRIGDVVIKVNGKEIENSTLLRNLIAILQPGSQAVLTVIRDNREKQVRLTVKERPSPQPEAPAETPEKSAMGLQVQAVTGQIASQLDSKEGEGVVITGVQEGSAAEDQGLGVGDIVLQADRKTVNTPEQFDQAVNEAATAGRILLLIKRDGLTHFIVVSL